MKQFFMYLLLSMGLILNGCGSGGESSDDTGGGNSTGGSDAPVLASIGEQNISPGATLTLNLSASDANGDSLSFTRIVLSPITPFNPPSGIQAIWTTGTNTATFSWSPTVDDDGGYLVRFTVTDNSSNAYSDSEEVIINVMGSKTISAMNGESVYNNECANCHSTGRNAEKMCKLVGDIQDAIGNNDGGMGSISITQQQIADVAEYTTYLGNLYKTTIGCN